MHQGHDVTVAVTLAEALLHLKAMPDAVILDLMLPDGNGIDLLQQARAQALPVRIVVTTGMMDAPVLDEVQRLKPYALMTKPIDIGQLLKTLE